jgi:IPT/TIG domain
MATRVVCDACGEVIDQAQPYYSAQVSKLQVNEDGALIAVESAQQRDYHVDHLPNTGDPESVATLSALNPSSPEQSDGETITLHVIGDRFVDTASIVFDGFGQPTTYVSSSELTCQASLDALGSFEVFVRQMGVDTNKLTFTVIEPGGTPPPEPEPLVLTSINPTQGHRSAQTAVTAIGTGFDNTAVVVVAGMEVATTFTSDTELDFTIDGPTFGPGYKNVLVRQGGTDSDVIEFRVT